MTRHNLQLLALWSICLTLASVAAFGCGSNAMPALTATATHEAVQLAWGEDDPNAVSFNIYREDGSGGFEKIGNSTAKWYDDSTIVSGKTYSYEVMAVDASGVESEPSNVVTAVVP